MKTLEERPRCRRCGHPLDIWGELYPESYGWVELFPPHSDEEFWQEWNLLSQEAKQELLKDRG